MSSSDEQHIQTQLKLVARAFRAGDLRGANQAIDRLLQRCPTNAGVLRAKGQIALSGGDQAAALQWLTASLQTDPDNLEALDWASFLSLTHGRFAQAEAIARRFATVAPQNARAHALHASALNALGRVDEALAAIDRSIALNPRDAESQLTRGGLLTKAHRPASAIDAYRKSLSIRPTLSASVGLAEILLNESHPEEALEVLEPAIMELSEADRPHMLVARAYTQMQRFEEADAQWSLARKHGHSRAAIVRAQAFTETAVGRFDVAEGILRQAIDEGVAVAESFFLLTRTRKMAPDDAPLLDAMGALLKKGGFAEAEAAAVNYGLGKTYDDLRDYERAIGHFDEANRIDFGLYPVRRSFNPDEAMAVTERHFEYFTDERIDALRSGGLESSLPLFIVGMVRSGTTLTETVLGAHSKVKPGGEQMFWTQWAAEFLRWTPDQVQVDHDQVGALARNYLALIDPMDTGIRYVTDKNPTNVHLADLLHCVFPNAKMVHLKRNPVDNLLSMWMTPFGAGVRCASNRENLVCFYREYLRLWNHLQALLPKERFLTVRYEELTSHPVETTLEILQYLELAPEEACFAPERSSRAVLTPSVHQVRQPINRGSQARWKNYRPWLGAFAELLEDPDIDP